MLGTAGDPAAARTLLAAWQTACDQVQQLGELMLEQYGIKVYLHPEQNNWNSSTTRRTRSSRASTGSTSSPRTPTRATCSSSPTLPHVQRARPLPGPGRRVAVGRRGLDQEQLEAADGLAHQGRQPRRPDAVAPPGNPFTQTDDPARLPAQRRRRTSSTPPRATSATARVAASPAHADRLGFDPGARRRRTPGPDPTVIGLQAAVHGDPVQPREGLQVPHRRVRQRSRRRGRPGPFAAAREGQRQAAPRAQVAGRRIMRFVSIMHPLRVVLAALLVLLCVPAGALGARRRGEPLSRDGLALPVVRQAALPGRRAAADRAARRGQGGRLPAEGRARRRRERRHRHARDAGQAAGVRGVRRAAARRRACRGRRAVLVVSPSGVGIAGRTSLAVTPRLLAGLACAGRRRPATSSPTTAQAAVRAGRRGTAGTRCPPTCRRARCRVVAGPPALRAPATTSAA